ncbi:MAG: ATP-binding protein, partial [Burkholderiales bacterium]
AVVLAVFVALSAFALERAFRDSALSARDDRLLAQIYLLMAAAEVSDDGTLRVSSRSAEPRLGLPDSGLYATIIDGNGAVVWQSRSGLTRDLPPVRALAAGKQTFNRVSRNGTQYLVKNYGINWSTDSGSYPFTFDVMEDSSALDEQIDVYRHSLWSWLGAMAALLLLSQWATLRWGLAPLRKVSNELGRLEAGEKQRLDGRYPSEVQRLADNLNAVLTHEHQQQQRYRNALADLAHSLKTPLALVRGTAHDSASTQAHAIEEQVDQMDKIIGYHLQRAAASGRSTLSAAIALRPVAERIVAALAKVYSEKNPDIRIDIDSNVRFRGDEGDLTEILGNLLDNACKWCRKSIRIAASNVNATLHIFIEDDGPGIDAADAARVFRRGTRADESVPGHGIGLAVVREIVEAYGGSASVRPSTLGGARVELQLPGAN